MTPYEIGYGPFVKFDHDFIGSEALAEVERRQAARRKKVTFAWNGEDVSEGVQLDVRRWPRATSTSNLPLSNYASSSFDKISLNGKHVGFSMFGGYSYNEKSDAVARHR